MSDVLNITPMFSPRMIRDALENASVKGVTVNDNGTLSLPEDDAGMAAAVSSLAGAVMTLYVVQTMVMDSNGVAIERVADELRDLSAADWRSEFHSEYGFREHLRGEVADRLDSIAANLRNTPR